MLTKEQIMNGRYFVQTDEGTKIGTRWINGKLMQFNDLQNTKPLNKLVVWRRNGKTKLWKTRPDDFRVPIKYGLREYSYITPENVHLFTSDHQ